MEAINDLIDSIEGEKNAHSLYKEILSRNVRVPGTSVYIEIRWFIKYGVKSAEILVFSVKKLYSEESGKASVVEGYEVNLVESMSISGRKGLKSLETKVAYIARSLGIDVPSEAIYEAAQFMTENGFHLPIWYTDYVLELETKGLRELINMTLKLPRRAEIELEKIEGMRKLISELAGQEVHWIVQDGIVMKNGVVMVSKDLKISFYVERG